MTFNDAKHWWGLYRMHGGEAWAQRRVHAFNLWSALLPDGLFFAAVRAALLRRCGATVEEGAMVFQGVCLRGVSAARVRLGCYASLGMQCLLQCDDEIVIGAHAVLGQRVHIVTASHQIGPPQARVGETVRGPVVIEAGAWVAAQALLLPGVCVGAGGVVAAGAVVTRSVAPGTLVAGIPARFVRRLDNENKNENGQESGPVVEDRAVS